jgi:hypothetical protein
MKKIMVLLSLFFIVSTAQAFSLRPVIQDLQERFGNARPWPILIFDQDELDWRFVKERALGEGDELLHKRVKIIRHYVKEKIHIDLSDNEAIQLEVYVNALKDGAFAYPILLSQYPARYKMCAVFPASANSNTRLENERLLLLQDKKIHPHREFEHYQYAIDYASLARLSLYHELAHCLDDTFLPKTFEFEDPHQVHLSESFAETLGLLMMRSEGFPDISRERALMRTVYSFYGGSYFAQNPQLGFGHPFFVAGGAIYYLAPVIEAQAKEPPEQELSQQAKRIVEKHALDFRGFNAIVKYLGEGESAITHYQANVERFPDLFEQAMKTLEMYVSTVP